MYSLCLYIYVYYESRKRELKRIYINRCRYNERLNAKTDGSKHLHTLGSAGRNNSEPSSGSSGHVGGTRPGQT